MKNEQEALPGVESEVTGESKEERTVRRNFYSDAARAGLHSSAMDILEQFNAGGVPDGAACLMAGACQFIAELYEETAQGLGADKAVFKKHMVDSVSLYFDTYAQMSVRDALAMAAGQPRGQGEKVQ